jgi:hypothetical protein
MGNSHHHMLIELYAISSLIFYMCKKMCVQNVLLNHLRHLSLNSIEYC